jgi:hypothetical protein
VEAEVVMSAPTADRKLALEVAARPRAVTDNYQDAPVDVKVVLAALWTAMLFVFAYVDIFGFFRADVLRSALDGTVASLDVDVNQVFLLATLGYVLVPALMVVLSLLLKPRVNRRSNITISVVYIVTIIVSCIGETWAYYLVGSAVEVLLLAAIARTAWRWPQAT